MTKKTFHVPVPELQIDFSFALAEIRNLYLQDALSKTIRTLTIAEIDKELAAFVPSSYLSELASHGLRGELLFPVPIVLRANPVLLGYYRLLLGFSQKEFYTAKTGASPFKMMEEKGRLTEKAAAQLQDLCQALIASGCALFDGIGSARLSRELLDDLTILTLGPQLRGGANVKKGTAAIVRVFKVIHSIVKHAAMKALASQIVIRNAAGRKVLIEFAPDPDIIIREEMSKDNYRNMIALEIKGGTDFSNIHNRLGEAEKSHQKARIAGYVECWTVVNVDRIDIDLAKKESPSTNRFYRLSELESRAGEEYADFKNRIISLTGIASKKARR
jgi:hypothetical protein